MKRNNIHGEESIYTSIESCKSVTFESLDLQMTYDIYISNLEPNLLHKYLLLSWPQNSLEWSSKGLRERIDDYKLCKIKQSRR